MLQAACKSQFVLVVIIISCCPYDNSLQVLQLKENAQVEKANETNLSRAVCAALLLLPQTFSEQLLFTTIANLSYSGMLPDTWAVVPYC